MSTIPLDYTQDVSGRETHRLTTLCSPPDFVKHASADWTTPRADMPRHQYADPMRKLYPCHNAAATWLSAMYFADKAAQFDEKTAAAIQTRIHDAARYFGILGQVAAAEEKIAAAGVQDLNQLPDADFAIVWVADEKTASKERHWPLRNETEVKFAAAHFARYRDDFVFEDRHTIASRILTKAAEYGADISEHVHTLSLSAGHGACAAKVAADMLRDRATLVRRVDQAASAELLKLAAVVEANPDTARLAETRLKIAAAVDELDRTCKLYRMYDDGLERPEEVLFAVTEKAARDFMADNVETVTGNVYALADLEKLAVEDVRNWMGEEFADAVTAGGVFLDREKLAAIVPTLDRGMANTLDRLMQEKKIAAVVQTKAASSLLSLDDLYALASQAE